MLRVKTEYTTEDGREIYKIGNSYEDDLKFHYYTKKDGTPYLKYAKEQIGNLSVIENRKLFEEICEDLDIPYLEKDIAIFMLHYGDSFRGILGRYISKMKLHDFKHWGYKDTQELINRGYNDEY